MVSFLTMSQNLKTFRVFYKNGQQLTVKAAKVVEGVHFSRYHYALLDEQDKPIENVFLPIDEILYVLPVDVIVPPGPKPVA
jgi:hypothetical protein